MPDEQVLTETVDTEVPVDTGAEAETTEIETTQPETQEPETQEIPERQPEQTQEKEEPELSEFRGMVSNRLRRMVKDNPQLAQAFKANPKLQGEIEARFRREAAHREIFPTVAEARTMRERFPNGLADVQALEEDVHEVEEIDNAFDTRDVEGNYPGHRDVINRFFERDRDAAIALLKASPREWARLDPDSYNEVMGKIVGATFQQRQIPQYVARMAQNAKAAGQDSLAADLTELQQWMEGYSAGPKPLTEEQRSLARDREKFQRETTERSQADAQRFEQNFSAEASKIQTDLIKAHPAIKRLESVASISEEKRNKIIQDIQEATVKLLKNSPSFMRKLRPAYQSRNLEESKNIIRAGWSQPWLLNRMVRTVLARETPQMVNQNRDAAARRASAARPATPVNTGVRRTSAPKGPHQVGGIWYKGDGTKFTMAEILQGKHQAA